MASETRQDQKHHITETATEARQGRTSRRHRIFKVLTTSTSLTAIALIGAALLFILLWYARYRFVLDTEFLLHQPLHDQQRVRRVCLSFEQLGKRLFPQLHELRNIR